MSDASSDPNVGSDKTAKRNLPSWMNSKQKGDKFGRKKANASEDATNHVKGSGNSHSTRENFSKLLERVVFALSGFVNPERSTLRSQALEMGAEYRSDWTSDCTLLVCAFSNTPKFRQVQSDHGTIVSKEWISECYNQKKLVDIEPYLMNAGKPWRRNNKQLETNRGFVDSEAGRKWNSMQESVQDVSNDQAKVSLDKNQKNKLPEEPRKQVEKRAHAKLAGSVVPEEGLSDTIKVQFSPSKIKEWALDDLRTTMSWLENQEEKPETNELKNIAAEGIITCLQDAIESLKQNHDIRLVIEQWRFVPRVVKELAELEGTQKEAISNKEISGLAVTCKRIYESELDRLDGSPMKSKTRKTDGGKEDGVQNMSEDAEYDSDQTIEMTEEEIELAYKQLT